MRTNTAGKVTLQNIAELSEISVSAVSMALRGSPQISKKTQKRVLAISKKLGYKTPAERTAGLRGQGGKQLLNKIGFMLLGRKLHDEAYSRLLQKTADLASKLNIRVEFNAIEDIGDLDMVQERIKSIAKHVDATLLTGVVDSSLVARLDEDRIPNCVMGSMMSSESDPTELASGGRVINADEIAMGKFATNYLIRLGHKRIAFVCETIPKGMHNANWLDGYRLAHWDNGIDIDPDLIHITGKLYTGAQSAVENFLSLKDKPTGFCLTDTRVAASFIQEMNTRGIKIDVDSLITGGDLNVARHYRIEKYPIICVEVNELVKEGFRILRDICENRSWPTIEINTPFKVNNISKSLLSVAEAGE